MIPAMRRLARWMFALFSSLSLAACIGVLIAWAASYRVQPTVSWQESQRLAGGGVARGAVFYGEVRQPPGALAYFGPPYGRTFLLVRPPMRDTGGPNVLTTDREFAGFVYRLRSPPLTYLHVAVPCWSLAVAFAIMPTASLAARRARRRRSRRGFCPSCGYDLRASPDRCPECGTQTARM